jgi:4-hydroxy-tetrahydrodipicolinate reductase
MIKTALIGYGSMGREIESIAKANGLDIVDIFDVNNPLKENKKYNFDVAIEFTTPDSVLKNTEILAKNGINVVIGTTGWYNEIAKIKKIVIDNKIGLVWGSNFSIGMQMFFEIVKKAAELVDKFEEYDVMIHELHHKRKKDSPSGTAETLSEIILREIARKKSKLYETAHKEINPDELHVTSTRGGEIFGTHTVYLDSLADTLELTHRARNRKGFALGAVKAAKFIYQKKGIHSFTEIFSDL